MKAKLKGLLLALFMWLALLFPAAAQDQQETICADRDKMVVGLMEEFKEHHRGVGLIDEGAMLEVFISEEGTWTLLVTSANKVSCILTGGENWYYDPKTHKERIKEKFDKHRAPPT